MELKHPFIFLIFFCFLCSSSMAFNITKILNITGYGTFNSLLSTSGLAAKINSRQTITVLAVKDGSTGDLSSKDKDVVARVLSTHVILDYYDADKLKNLDKRSSILTTLYQTTGDADNQEGFLNVTKTQNGIMFGSAKKGSPLTASLVGSVDSQPYNISVLQVSTIIDGSGVVHGSPPSPPPPPAPESAPSPADSPADAPAADAPAADSPAANAPSADSPAADAPAADSPAASPPQPDSDAPADAPAADESSSSTLLAGGVATVMVVVAAGIVGV